MVCDGAVKAEAPVARRAADAKRVDSGAMVLLQFWLVGVAEDQKIRRRGEVESEEACWWAVFVEEEGLTYLCDLVVS